MPTHEQLKRDLSPESTELCQALQRCFVDNSFDLTPEKYPTHLRNALEMRHTLSLVAYAIGSLSGNQEFEKEKWLAELHKIIDEQHTFAGSIREQTGKIIIDKIEAAPWNADVQPGATRSERGVSASAIFAAIRCFVIGLNENLRKAEDAGWNLKDYDVEEVRSSDEEDTEEDEANPEEEDEAVKELLKQLDTTSEDDEASTAGDDAAKELSEPAAASEIPLSAWLTMTRRKRAPGNVRQWELEETIHLLRVILNKPHASERERTESHNQGFWSDDVAKYRTRIATRLKIQSEVAKGPPRKNIDKLQVRIVELEWELRERNSVPTTGSLPSASR